MLPLSNLPFSAHRVDRFFILSIARYRGSLFVVSPDDISLVENYSASPEQSLDEYLRAMENNVFEVMKYVRPVLCLAARQNLRQRFESISRIPNQKALSLDRYYGPTEKRLLHRYVMSLIQQRAGSIFIEKYRGTVN
jgi:hypothetical protein